LIVNKYKKFSTLAAIFPDVSYNPNFYSKYLEIVRPAQIQIMELPIGGAATFTHEFHHSENINMVGGVGFLEEVITDGVVFTDEGEVIAEGAVIL